MNTSESADLPLSTRVNQQWARLSKTERVVARHLVASAPQEIILATAGEIGARTGTSDATVVRTARRLGYSGLPELKSSVGAQLSPPGPPQLSSRLVVSQTAEGLSANVSRVVDDAVDRLTQFSRAVDPAALAQTLDIIATAGEVMCYGWGSNELSARYLALKLNRVGKRSRFSGATGYTLADDLLGITAQHVVVMFAPGRMLPDLRIIADHTRATGAKFVLITESLQTSVTDAADVVLHDVGSPGGLTAEPLCAMLITDLLVLGIMATDQRPAVDTYELLTRLRTEIVDDSR